MRAAFYGQWIEVGHPERDIEERLAAHYASEADTLGVTRQFRLPGYGRPDIVVQTAISIDEPVLTTVIEVKATRAGMTALRQLQRYLDGFRILFDRWDVEYELVGLLIAPSFTRAAKQYEAECEIAGVPIRLHQVAA